MKYFSTLSFILILFSCGSKHLSKEQSNTISFEKTGCLNKCRAYKISISSSGQVSYHGMENVSPKGKWVSHLKKGEVKKLWKTIKADSLLLFKDSYNYGDEDTQQHFLKYYSNEKLLKEIRFGPFPPPLLQQIDAAIDQLVKTREWRAVR